VKLPPVIAVTDGVQAFGQFNKVHRALLKAYSFGGITGEGKGQKLHAHLRNPLCLWELGSMIDSPRLNSL
jgi:hypothetical protein